MEGKHTELTLLDNTINKHLIYFSKAAFCCSQGDKGESGDGLELDSTQLQTCGEQAWRGLPDLEGTAAGGGDVRGGRRRSWAGRWQET